MAEPKHQAAWRHKLKDARDKLDEQALRQGYKRFPSLSYRNADGEVMLFDNAGELIGKITTEEEVEVMTAGELAEQYDDDDLGLEI